MEGKLLQRVVSRRGCDIHYWISHWRNRSWLIFLHGAGCDHEMFNEQLQLVNNFNILLWDARGHGLSRPMGESFSIPLVLEDLVEIMNKEGIEQATFIGQSMGGNIAQEMAFYYPNKVEKLVLIDCTCNTMQLSSLEKFYLNITPLLIRLYPWSYLVNASVKASALNTDVQHYLRKVFNLVGKKDFVKIFLATAACLHDEEDYKINKPMLLVYGEKDRTGNIKKIAPTWAASEPQCQLVKIPNASHCSNQDNPTAFNKAIIEFLNK
ncbi:alpha/beta fold hydrolase [Hazenella coriacea]|uniref:Pimeloyl-ACP methyl ester carboxylesterase n=1 Tax=Hazenella coriacea TaxID=1179467 RepID=A0A4R3L7W2_9BACL|nr:alpha/beta hydrolase [Hazenella coriacea]TCS95873.1 pimeloyl-ACP methyl ester carboxylesterase [Hazenella coriacea]